MDFLDPKYLRRHTILLYVGYALIAVAVVLTTWLLVAWSDGLWLNNQGKVVQYGSLFVSSSPSGANIVLNNHKPQAQTNARLSLLAGKYDIKLQLVGYRTWQQSIVVQGGVIGRYDYPFLFPNTLKTTTVGSSYATRPAVMTQSPDKRWVLIQQSGSNTTFDMYDLNSSKLAAVALAIPNSVASSGTMQQYQVIDWADDNQHVLLRHTYDAGKYEFILLDRTDPSKSINLSTTLEATPTTMQFINKKYDQYYLYDGANQTLSSASLGAPTPVMVLQHVLTYKDYGDHMLVYASSLPTDNGKVVIYLKDGGKTYALRTLNAGTTYLLNLTQYAGSWLAVIGASSEGKVYVYKNPENQLNSKSGALVPIAVLKLAAPNYVSFSPNARFIVAENGTNFAVYDAEFDNTMTYNAGNPMDSPQQHATWMDGNHLQYVSAGKLLVFDFDHGNAQQLMAADPSDVPAYYPDYSSVIAIRPDVTIAGQWQLTNTALIAQ